MRERMVFLENRRVRR